MGLERESPNIDDYSVNSSLVRLDTDALGLFLNPAKSDAVL